MKKFMAAFLVSILAAVSVTAASAAELKFDTPSEEYTNYMKLPPEERQKLIPPMQARLRPEEDQAVLSSAGNLPEKFDLRDMDTDGDGIGDTSCVTPIRNQRNTNTCYAFAFVSSAESRWKYQTGEDIDLSELHIYYSLKNKLNSGQFNPDGGMSVHGSGSQPLMVSAYAARGSGLVLESELPLKTDTGEEDAYLSNTYIAPSFRASEIKLSNFNPTNQKEITNIMINRLKADVMKGSAVTVGMYHDLMFENDFNCSFYNNSTQFGEANHAVAIVGWDDTYPAENFNFNPGRNGAWIVRNNWGEYNENNGYMYVSYMDKSTYEKNIQVLSMEDYRDTGIPYDNRYYHDPSWFTNSIGYTNSNNTIYGMNVFDKQPGNEAVQMVNLAFNGPTDYEVYIVDNYTDSVDISNSEPVASGHSSYAGYFDIPLESPVVVSGDKFAVIVKYHADDEIYIVPIEQKMFYPYIWYDYYSTAPPNSSYTSPDGIYWEEISTAEIQANCTIKAFTKNLDSRSRVEFKLPNIETTVYVTNSDGKRISPNTDGTYTLCNGSYSYTTQKEGYDDKTIAFTVESDMTIAAEEPDMFTGIAPYVNNEILYSLMSFDSTPLEVEISMGTGAKAAHGLSISTGTHEFVEGKDYFINDSKIIFLKKPISDDELYEMQGYTSIFTVEFDDEAKTTQEFYVSARNMDALYLINSYIANNLDISKEDIKAYANSLPDTQVVFGDDFDITGTSITGKMIITHNGENMVRDYTGYSRVLTRIEYVKDSPSMIVFNISRLAGSPYETYAAVYYEDGRFSKILKPADGYIGFSYNTEPYTLKFLQWKSMGGMVPLMEPYVVKMPAWQG